MMTNAATPAPLPQLRTYPIPPDSPKRLFFLQRSMNSNTVVYDARLRSDGTLDPERPIEAYWLRYNTTGERRALSFIEQVLAFGPVTERIASRTPAWTVHVAGYPERSTVLKLDAAGRPVLLGQISGREAKFVSAYLHLEEGDGSAPRVKLVDLFGLDAENGKPLHERFIP